MTEEKLTHWKKLKDNRFVGSWDFQPNQELTIEIESVYSELTTFLNGEKKLTRFIKIKGAKKPYILNEKNGKIAEKVLGTPYVEKWIGRKLILYVHKTTAFGEWVDTVGVKNQKVD